MASCSIQTRVPDDDDDDDDSEDAWGWWRGDVLDATTDDPLGVEGRDIDSDDRDADSATMMIDQSIDCLSNNKKK
jgi:hypothetical protein